MVRDMNVEGRRPDARSRGTIALVALLGLLAAVGVVTAARRVGLPGGACPVQPVRYSPIPLPTGPAGRMKHAFVVTLENTPAAKVFDQAEAPYLNSLLPRAARAATFVDLLKPAVVSEPHYLLMEAGTATFSDGHICGDGDASAKNSTASTAHFVTQLAAASRSWMSYQEGLDPATTGACPINSGGNYAPKHNPFVFFRDVAGSPPSRTNAACAAHHRPHSALASDLASGDVADYVFVTPDLCHDMHDACDDGLSRHESGDNWLAANLPAIIDFADHNDGVVFLVWDEGSLNDGMLPFLALGPAVKAGTTSTGTVTHRSLLRTLETMFGVPILPSVADANDLSELFVGDRPPRFS
jgi:phosphatidylinositol-3-phosphatase